MTTPSIDYTKLCVGMKFVLRENGDRERLHSRRGQYGITVPDDPTQPVTLRVALYVDGTDEELQRLLARDNFADVARDGVLSGVLRLENVESLVQHPRVRHLVLSPRRHLRSRRSGVRRPHVT